jgi:glycosyltransferase involved in cell wall biosynthesis
VRIAGQNSWPVFRGGERALAAILAGLQARGHPVMMVCGYREVAEGAAACGIPTRVVSVRGDARLDQALRLARALRDFRPDAAILGTFRKALPAAVGARLAGVPRVVCRVGIQTDVPRSPKYRFVFRRLVDVAVMNAAGMREAFLAADPGLDPARVVAIPTGVRVPQRRKPAGALRRELGIPEEARVLGTLAHLAPHKRHERVVHVLAGLPEDVHYLAAGAGPRRAELEALAGALGVGGRLHLLGPREDVGDVLAALDLYVVSSAREGMSNAMLEALASGVPVVSTPVSGAAEALGPLGDGARPGLVVEPEALGDAIARLLAEPAELRRMGDAARRAGRERFSYARMISDYERLLAGGASR